jgi:GNAT superfamily N-acetyltransferase
MTEDIIIEPMTEKFLLWHCLHGGPLSPADIDQYPDDTDFPWARYRERNIPLLQKLTRIYGTCAIVARVNDRIVGMLRFYPKAVWHMKGAGALCLLQDSPAGPADNFAASDFPLPEEIKDKTLVVHCLMTGSPQQEENPYQRIGLGSLMVRELITWAKANGWTCIEADSFEDLPIIYEITGSAGHTFWEKLGFHIADRYPHPELQESEDFVKILEQQAKVLGIAPEKARDQIIMRLDLE